MEGTTEAVQMPPSIQATLAHASETLSTVATPSKRIKITANNGRPLLNLGKLRPQKKFKLEATLSSENDTMQENGPRSLTKNRRGKSKLHLLVEMPLDILFEIFSNLGPHDVLLLSRTTKAFRRVLFQKHAISVWRSAMRNSPELPSCPEDISLPAWINLAFSAHCHNCLVHNVQSIYWELRIRLCKKCGKQCLLPVKNVKMTYKDVSDLILSCVPFVNAYGATSCSPDALMAFLAEITNVTKSDRNNIVNRRKVEVKTTFQHAEKCRNWDDTRTTNRHNELQDLRATRRNAIIKRLEELGYEEEIDYACRVSWSYALIPFDYHKLVNQNRLLTPRIWDNIKSGMIEYMEEVKIALAEKNRKSLLSRRNEAALMAWNSYLRSQPSERLYPSPMDILQWAPFQSIISQDSSILVTSESFALALANIPTFIEETLERQIKEVYNLAYPSCNLTIPGDLQTQLSRLRLAVCVLTCNNLAHNMLLDKYTHANEERYPWMWFPEFMAHDCNSIDFTRFDKNFDEAKDLYIEEYSECKRRKWSAENLVLDVKASNVVQAVVTACGKDWETTSVEDMDNLDARVICLKCSYRFKCDGERNMDVYTYSWRRAVVHSIVNHGGDSRVTWQRISEVDLAVVKIEEAKITNNMVPDKKWRCLWCRDTNDQVGRMSIPSMKQHYWDEHPYVTVPLQQDTHFYRAMDWTPRQPPSVKITSKKVPPNNSVSN